jgi:hypothetical protein
MARRNHRFRLRHTGVAVATLTAVAGCLAVIQWSKDECEDYHHKMETVGRARVARDEHILGVQCRRVAYDAVVNETGSQLLTKRMIATRGIFRVNEHHGYVGIECPENIVHRCDNLGELPNVPNEAKEGPDAVRNFRDLVRSQWQKSKTVKERVLHKWAKHVLTNGGMLQSTKVEAVDVQTLARFGAKPFPRMFEEAACFMGIGFCNVSLVADIIEESISDAHLRASLFDFGNCFRVDWSVRQSNIRRKLRDLLWSDFVRGDACARAPASIEMMVSWTLY